MGLVFAHLPEQYKLFTYMFLHGSILHLLFNMIFLFVFGDNVEDAMGHFRFILFYLACGVIGAIVYSAVTEFTEVPLIGASGAVSGVIGAYLMLHPNIRVWVLVPFPKLPFIPLRFSAAIVIGAWILYQFGAAVFFPSQSVALWAHVGGFFAGACPHRRHETAGCPAFRHGDRRISRTTLTSKPWRIDTFATAK